jgi:hypothetical protein
LKKRCCLNEIWLLVLRCSIFSFSFVFCSIASNRRHRKNFAAGIRTPPQARSPRGTECPSRFPSYPWPCDLHHVFYRLGKSIWESITWFFFVFRSSSIQFSHFKMVCWAIFFTDVLKKQWGFAWNVSAATPRTVD